MSTATGEYLGKLCMAMTHTASGTTINTDAGNSNNGKGDAFSPTDLVAVALASCSLTSVGAFAENRGMDFTGAKFEVEKITAKGPLRISEIDIIFTIPNRNFTPEQKESLERAAMACPVHRSLHPDIVKNITFNWL